MEMLDPYGWHKLDEPTIKSIYEKLKHFESMSLGAIFIEGKSRNHGVKLDKLSPEAQKRLRQLGYDATIEELYSLRLSGPERIWGIRECNVYSILWWDPHHQVCPSLR
jgi:hypothetical protein